MNKLIFIYLVLVSFLLSQNQNIIIDEIEVRGNEMISDYNIKFISKLESGTRLIIIISKMQLKTLGYGKISRCKNRYRKNYSK